MLGLSLSLDIARARAFASGPVSLVGTSAFAVSSGAANFFIGKPGNVAVGDYLVAIVMARSAITPPAGWTLLADGNDSTQAILQHVSFFGKVAVSPTDRVAAENFPQANATAKQDGIIIALRGTGSVTPVVGLTATGFTQAVNGASTPIAGLTAANKGLAIAVVSPISFVAGGETGSKSDPAWNFISPGPVFVRQLVMAYRNIVPGQVLSGNLGINEFAANQSSAWAKVTVTFKLPNLAAMTWGQTTPYGVISGQSVNPIAGSDSTHAAFAIGDAALSAGKYYFEAETSNGSNGSITSGVGIASYAGGALPLHGIGTLATELDIGGQEGFYQAWSNNTQIGTNNNDCNAMPSGLVRWGFAIDVAARKVWVRNVTNTLTKAWHLGGDPVAGTTPTWTCPGTDPLYLAGSARNATDSKIVLVTDAAQMVSAAPTGFTKGLIG
jgi:hypothetical protein